MKSWNKRGVMLEFLVAVILALLIFTPTCMFSAKIFRLSQQAEDNFGHFVQQIKELSTIPGGERRIETLILDEETALLYFEAQKELKLDILLKGMAIDFSADIIFQRPAACPLQQNCLCLIKKYTLQGESSALGGSHVRVVPEPEATTCAPLPLRLQMTSCDPANALLQFSYTCTGGLVIERNLVKDIEDEFNWLDTVHHSLPRRIPLNLLKTPDNTILLTPELPQLPQAKEKEK